MTPRTNASIDDVGAGGVATGGATGAVGAVAAGAEVVALVSVTGTAAYLYALGTPWNSCVVALPFLSCASSWISSTVVCISVTFKSRS